MIGPRTDIAPMRAFLQQRSHLKHRKEVVVEENILYSGCQHGDSDFVYGKALKQFREKGVLTRLHVAFGAEENHKLYIQCLISERAKETWDLIERQQASIYVYGGTEICIDVSEAITNVAADVGGKGMEEAKAYVDSLRSEGRFVQELCTH